MFIQTLKNRVLFERTLTPVLSVLFAIATITYGGFLFSADKAYAATNNTLNFQARLEGSGGAIAPDGYYNVEFKLYSVSTGGSALWTETYYDSNGVTAGNDNRIRVQNGYLTANLGSITAFPGTISWDQDLYITLNVGGTTQTATPTWDGEMNPRLKLTGVPYAFRAGQLAQFNVTSGFTSTLSLLQPTVGNQTFQIQDQGAAGTYNICIQNSAACGFVAGTASNFIQNSTSLQASSNFNISGTGIASTLQATAFDTAAAGTLSIGTTNATTVNIATNAVAHTIAIGTSATAAQTITIGSSNASSTTSITGGASSLSVANSGLTIAGNTTTSGTISTTAGGAAGAGTQALASSLYIQSRGTNLVTNGTGLLGNNYNFSGFVFDPQYVSAGGGSFKNSTASANVTNDELLPVDPNSTYQLNLAAMSSVYVAGNRAYFGIAPYDIDGLAISPYQYSKHPGSTDTTLAAPLNPGDTTVTLTNASGWYNSTGSYQSNFAWYGYTNSKGYTYPDYTYSRTNSYNYSSNSSLGAWDSGGISGNVITLRVPWAGPAIASGVAVRNSTSGGSYKYIAAANVEVPSTWTTYTGRIGGIDVNGTQASNLFPYGSAYVKLLFLMNRDVTGNTTNLSNISFTDNSGVFQAKTAPSVPVIVQGAASQTGNLFQAQSSTGSVLMGVTSTGLINTTAGFSYNGTAGATTTCGAGTYLNSQVIQGGITTGGTCTTVPTGVGSFVSLQGSTPGTPDTGNLNITGTGIFGTAVQAPLYDTASAVALNIGTTNATVINLNKDVTVASGKYISLVGGITSTRPASPTEGMLYYDTTTRQLLVYANGKWQADRSSSTVVVGTSAAGGVSGAVASKAPDGADFVNTSTTSAQTVINSAIAALPATGGTVYLMEGTYIVDESITLPSNVTLEGTGHGTVIKAANSLALGIVIIKNSDPTNGNSGITIKNLKVDGNRYNNTSTTSGIRLDKVGSGSGSTAVPGGKILNVMIEKPKGDGIQIFNSNNSSVSGTTVLDVQNEGIEFDNSDFNRVSDTTIQNSASALSMLNSSNRNDISENTFDGSLGSGSYAVIINGSSGNTITSNMFIDNLGGGISLTVSSYTYMANNNIIDGGGSGAVHAIYLGSNSDFVSIIGNQIVDNSGSGDAIYISNVNNDSTYIANNSLVGVGADSIMNNGTGTIYVNQIDGSGKLINKSSGGSTVQSTTNTTTAFQVQNAAGSALLNADTANMKISLDKTSFALTGFSQPAAPSLAASSNQGGTLSGVSGTTYYYKVTAINAAGESIASGEASFAATNFAALTPPAAATVAVNATAGNLNGTYTYKITFVTANGETTGGTTSAAVSPLSQQVDLSAIPTGPAGTTARKIYRTAAGGADGTQKLVTTLADNITTIYTDNLADASLGAALPGTNTARTNTNNLTITFTTVTGATSYRIYRGTTAGGQNAYQTTTTSPFTDTGAAGTAATPPVNDSTARLGIGTATPTASLDVVGDVRFRNQTDSSAAFRIQNAAGNEIITVDSSANQVVLGKAGASGIDGKLMFQNAANANTVAISSGVTSASYAMTLPTAIAATGDCLKAGTVAGGNVPLTFGTCATSNPTLQNVYDNSGTASPQILLNATNGGIKIADAATPISGNLLSIQNNAATATYLGLTSSALTLQDSSGNSAFVFDSGTSRLRVYEDVTTPTRYAEIYYDSANNQAVFAASSGDTRVGSGSGNITGNLTGQNDIYNFTKTYTPAGAYSLNDFTIQRALTAGTLSASGSVLKIEDASTGSAVAPDVLLINQNNTSATGNLIVAQTGGATTRMALSTGGNLTVSGNYISGASTGVARTCTSGQVIAAETTVGGIVTGGTCTAVSTLTTMQNAYDNSSSPASILLGDAKNFVVTAADTATDPSVLINLQCVTSCLTNGRFAIQDAGTDVFTVNPDGSIVVGSAANGMTFDATTKEPTLNGTARHTRRITLSAEYAGASMTADGTSNIGSMTSDNMTTSPFRNFYKWTNTQGTAQDYDIWVRVPVPTDYAGLPTGQTICVDVYSSSIAANNIALTLYDSTNTSVTLTDGDLAPSVASTWQNQCTSTITGGTYTANGIMTLQLKLTAPATTGDTRVGDITFDYFSKW